MDKYCGRGSLLWSVASKVAGHLFGVGFTGEDENVVLRFPFADGPSLFLVLEGDILVGFDRSEIIRLGDKEVIDRLGIKAHDGDLVGRPVKRAAADAFLF